MKAYKTKLLLSNKERGYLNGCAGAARYIWNWMLARHDEMFRAGQPIRIAGGNADNPDKPSIKKQFRDAAREMHPWVYMYSSQIVDNVAINLNKAFSNYWNARKGGTTARLIAEKKANGAAWDRWLRRQLKQGRKGVQVEPGYPQYKGKYRARVSFSVSSCEVENGRIKIGAGRLAKEFSGHWFRLAEGDYIPDGKHKTTTFSQDKAGVWYVSVGAEYDPEPLETTGEILGVDIGVAVAVATSDGALYANNRRLARYEKRINILKKKLARQEKKSNNWKQTKARIGKLYAKVARARSSDRHSITADIVYQKRPSLIRLENLQVQNMTRAAKPKPREDGNGYAPNRKKQKAGLNRAMLEVAPYKLRRQIEYKSKWAGVAVEAVPPAYTSQTCSRCGHVAKENRPSQAHFECVKCGYRAHADINAACVIRDTNP